METSYIINYIIYRPKLNKKTEMVLTINDTRLCYSLLYGSTIRSIVTSKQNNVSNENDKFTSDDPAVILLTILLLIL